MIEIGVFIHNMVLYYTIRPLLEEFSGRYKIFIPKFKDKYWERMAENTYRYLKGKGENVTMVSTFPQKSKIKVSISPMPYFDYKSKYNIKFLYGRAKESWGYDLYNINYDFIFCYGLRAVDFLSAYSRPLPIGPIKFVDYDFRKNKKHKYGERIKILYMPTYGEESSIDYLAPYLKQIRKKFDIKIKLHHGTTFLEPSRVKMLQGAGEIYDHTIRARDLFYWADVVLSDCSGAIFDAIYCDKKLLVYQPIRPKQISKNVVSLEEEIVAKGKIPQIKDPKDLTVVIESLITNKEADRKRKELKKEIFDIDPVEGLKKAKQIINQCLSPNYVDHYKITHDKLLKDYRSKELYITNLNIQSKKIADENKYLKEKISSLEYLRFIKYYSILKKLKIFNLLDYTVKTNKLLKQAIRKP